MQVMAATVISISSDLSVESVGSSFLLVILIGSISVEVSVAPKVGSAAVALPVGVLELDTHSSSEADPSKSSLPLIPTAPIPPVPSTNIISHVDAPPKIRRRWDILIRPREDIPIGRLYRTHPRRPCRALTARKSVRPLPSHCLALRHTSHHLDRFTSGSSSDHSSSRHSTLDHSSSDHPSSDHSSSRHSILGHSLSGHTLPVTTVVSPLSTMYLPTTSKSSAGDSSSELSAGPSRKRCWSPAAIVTSFIHASRALVPSRADLLPPRKRFRDSISSEDSVEEDIDTDVLADIEADTTTVEVDVRVDVEDKVEDEVKSSDRGTMEVRVDVVAGIDILMRELEARSVIAGGERASLLEQVVSLERSNARLRGTLIMESARANRFWRCMSFMESELRQVYRFRYYDRMWLRRLEIIAARRLDHNYYSLCQNGDDDDNGNVGGNGNRNNRGNGDRNGGGNGNGNRGGNGNGNANRNDRGVMPSARECTYHDFVKCQPLNFKGTGGVVGLTRWFEKMETIFHINNCPERYQVKYATCTLMNSSLTWWNAHKRTIGADAAFAISWRELMKLITEVYCPRNEIQKMESEL
ncbi:hypothetical protein Tco_0388859 [Tanacetum coccineum]